MPYRDAGALAKLYLHEPDSEELNGAIRGRRDLQVSDLGVTELVAALFRRRRERTLPPETAERLHRALLADLTADLFEAVLRLDSRTHREAERLLLTSSVPLRTLDSLHLALARSAAALCIVTFDGRLAQAARQIGLKAVP